MSNPEISSEPQFIIDDGIDPKTTEQLQHLHALIESNPESAEQIIALYAESGPAGDKWLKLLGGTAPNEKRYPFRLTAILGPIALNRTLRYVEHDKETEAAIKNDETVKKQLDLSRGAGPTDIKESFARRASLRRLEIYAGRLGAWRAIAQGQRPSDLPRTEAS